MKERELVCKKQTPQPRFWVLTDKSAAFSSRIFLDNPVLKDLHKIRITFIASAELGPYELKHDERKLCPLSFACTLVLASTVA